MKTKRKKIIYVYNPEWRDGQGKGGDRMQAESQQVFPGELFGVSEIERVFSSESHKNLFPVLA